MIRGHKFGRPSPTSCPAAAGRWIFLRAASNILLPAGSALHFPANSGSLHVLLCALRPLVTTWTFATQPMSQLGLTTFAASPFTACVTVRQPLLLASFPCSIDLSWRPLRPHPQCIPRRLASLTLPLKLTWSMQLPLLRGNTSSGRRSSCRQAVRPPRMHANSLAVGALPRLVPATPVTPVQIAHLSISPASTGYTILSRVNRPNCLPCCACCSTAIHRGHHLRSCDPFSPARNSGGQVASTRPTVARPLT